MLAIAGGLGEMGEAEFGVSEFFKVNQGRFPVFRAEKYGIL
jgi:hypothetical protein